MRIPPTWRFSMGEAEAVMAMEATRVMAAENFIVAFVEEVGG